MVDDLRFCIKSNRQPLRETSDQRAVAFRYTEIDFGVLISVVILHRQAVQLGAVDIGRDCVNQRVPAFALHQMLRGCTVLRRQRRRLQPLVERSLRCAETLLLPRRKALSLPLRAPRRLRFIHMQAKRAGLADQRVAVRRMQPAAAHVQRPAASARIVGERTTARPRAAFDHEHAEAARQKRPARRHTRRPCADHGDVDLIVKFHH